MRIPSVFTVILILSYANLIPAQSVEESERRIRVIQQKPFYKGLRAEVLPIFSTSLNENLTRHIGVGGVARFHITDEWAIGVDYIKYFGKLSSLATEVGDYYQVYPEKRLIDFFVGGNVSYCPVFGKFVLFGGPIIAWDIYLIAGGGALRTGKSAFRPAGQIGFGLRFAITQFLLFNIEVRDFMYQEKFNAGKEFLNNVMMTGGIGIMVPFSHKYKYPK